MQQPYLYTPFQVALIELKRCLIACVISQFSEVVSRDRIKSSWSSKECFFLTYKTNNTI
jgi:hypothetical protein